MRGLSTRVTALSAILFVGLVPLAPSAQTTAAQTQPRLPAAPAPPSRDVVLSPTTGTSSLAGVATVDETVPRPVRRVLLTLNGGGLRTGRMTVSDDEGRFFFGDLPAGRFTLSGSKQGFVTSHYGARKPWRTPGAQINLGPGERINDLSFKILRGGVITGTVRDPNGQPQSNLRIQVLENRPMNGELIWSPVPIGNNSGQTDDRGMYRVFGLPPGTYLVGVGGTPLSTAARLTSDAEVQWALQQAQAASRAMSATPGAAAQGAPPEVGPTVGYAPLYFPGTTDPSAATTLTLGPGEERTGIDITMQFVPTARVQGLITGADGQPAQNVRLMLALQGRANWVTSFEGQPGSNSDPNGRFMFQAVRPGQYTLIARAQTGPPPSFMSDIPRPVQPQMPGSSGSTLWAQIDLNVAGRDLTDVRLSLQPGMSLSGRIVFEGTEAPIDSSRITVSVRPAPNQSGPTFGAPPGGAASANGTFALSGVTPGLYLMSSGQVSAPNAPPLAGWVVKSIMVKGQDALDVPFEIQPNESLTDVVVTYTSQVTDIAGRLIDGAGQPVSGYFVLMFPTNRTSWRPGSRRLRPPFRTAPDGRYRIANLPPGEYFMVALTEFDSQDLYDPTFLEQVAASSFKFTLGEGEKKAMDLKIARQ